MKNLIYLSFFSLIFFACSDDEMPTDQLEEHGILGNWILVNAYTYELGSPTIIDDLAVDFGSIRFSSDENLDDLTGLFEKTEIIGLSINGIFTLVPSDSSILFEFDGKQMLVDYEIDEDELNISWLEDTTVILEDYRRE